MRLIDAEQLKHKINNSELYGTKEWENVLDMAFDCETVDAVPVVRCKDCIHCSKYDCWTENGVVTLNSCWNDKGMFTYVLDNDYCSRGYRRDNNG